MYSHVYVIQKYIFIQYWTAWGSILNRLQLIYHISYCFPACVLKRKYSLHISLSPVTVWTMISPTTGGSKPLGTVLSQHVIVFPNLHHKNEGWMKWNRLRRMTSVWPELTCRVYNGRVTQHWMHQDGANEQLIWFLFVRGFKDNNSTLPLSDAGPLLLMCQQPGVFHQRKCTFIN